MRKLFFFIAIGIIVLFISGVITSSSNLPKDLNSSDLTDIKQIDINSLPDQINITNVGNTSLAFYQVNSTTSKKPFFVISVGNTLQQLTKQTQNLYDASYLVFGISGEKNDSSFAYTSAGVISGLNKGYVMTRQGSITGISTNLEVNGINQNPINIILYKNGEEIGFGNNIDTSTTGIKNNYALQSTGVVNFNPGDVISAYIRSDGAVYKDATIMIEITTSQ